MRATDILRRRNKHARRTAGRQQRIARALTAAGLVVPAMLVIVAVFGFGAGAAGLWWLQRDLPELATPQQLAARHQPAGLPSRLFAWGEPDADGLRHPVTLDVITDPRRATSGWSRPGDLPPYVGGALLAAEDPAFLATGAPDLAAALTGWVRYGELSPSHSPLIRRLVADHLRDEPLTADASREAQAWLLGWQLERRYSREQLVELALNTRYYGHLAYGVEAAARVYFGKPAAELTPGEAALLAVAARDPSANPFDDPEAARRGRLDVLAMMQAMGNLTSDEAVRAATEPLALAPPPGSETLAPAFVRLARRELEAILGPDKMLAGGWQVETTLEISLQEQAACLVAPALAPDGGPPCPAREYLADFPPDGTPDSATLIALDPATGEIEALAGDPTGLSPRPAGTLVRPLIYLTALSQGYTAATLTMDVPSAYLIDGNHYAPRNDDGVYRGPLRLREALAAGRAVPAAQVLSWVGGDRVITTAQALGLGATDPAPDLTADGFSTTILELSRAFATVGNGGVMAGRAEEGALPRPATIRRINGPQGEELYAYAPEARDTLDPGLAYLLTSMLADDRARCATRECADARQLPDGRPAAVATGESAAGDAWAVGYTPGRLIGVWLDGDDATGLGQAVPLWRGLMAWSSAGAPVAGWPRPAGLRMVEVCTVSGMLPSPGIGCPTVREWFVPGTEPAETDTMVREVAVNRETGLLATIFTPPHLIERRTYIDYPPEAAAWAASAGIELPPTEYDTIKSVPTRIGGAWLDLEPWALVRGLTAITGSAGGEGFSFYRLVYSPGLFPEAMQALVERGELPVESAEVGVWDTTLVDDGLYTLLLTVVRVDGTFDEVAVPVMVANE